MSKKGVPEVLICGAGPVGLFAALALTRRGIRVQIVDRGLWACSHSYALALHPQSLRLFQEMGLHESVMQSAYPVRTIGIYDRCGRRAQVCLAGAGDTATCMPVLRQDVLERLLEQELHASGVPVLWRHAVASLGQGENGVAATIDRFEEESRGYVVARSEWMVADSSDIEVPFVIGADGYNSLVRRRLKLDYPEVAPAQQYAVYEFKSDAGPDAELKLAVRDGGTDVLWPVPGGYCRWAFQIAGDFEAERVKERGPASDPGRLPLLDQSSLRGLIEERAPWFSGSIGKFTWRTTVRFERRLASAFGRGRVWLAGDAAHVAGPAGVQSMNVGFFEAHDLAETLTRILRWGDPPDLLKAYNEKWTAVWRRLHGIEGSLRPEAEADPWIRDHCGQLLSCLPAHGDALAPLVRQLGLAM